MRQTSLHTCLLFLFLLSITACSQNTKKENVSPRLPEKTKMENQVKDSTVADNNVDYLYPESPVSDDWEDDIQNVFLLLPNELFASHSGITLNLNLTPERRKKLMQQKKITVNNHCLIEVNKGGNVTNKRDHLLLSIQECYDGAVAFDIRKWKMDDGTNMYSILRMYSDHCCDYTNYFFLTPVQNGWNDITGQVIDKIQLSDFTQASYNPAKIKALRKLTTDPWTTMFYLFDEQWENRTYDSSIMVKLNTEYIGLSFDEQLVDSLYRNMNARYLHLQWDGTSFRKKKILLKN